MVRFWTWFEGWISSYMRLGGAQKSLGQPQTSPEKGSPSAEMGRNVDGANIWQERKEFSFGHTEF